VVEKALEMFRSGRSVAIQQPLGQNESHHDRILKALTDRPLTPMEMSIIQCLYASSPDKWVSYKDLSKQVCERRIDGISNYDSMTIRTMGMLSQRMKQYLLPADYGGKTKALEGFVGRAKLKDLGICYRLNSVSRTVIASTIGIL